MKKWSWFSVSIVGGGLFFLSRGGMSSASTDGEQLFHRLFRNYNKHIRPVRHLGDVTNVTFYLTLLQLISVTEKTEEMTTSQYVTIRWEDPRLTWNPKVFGGISQIRVPSHKIWKPDLALHNNNDGNYDTSVPVNALLNYTGKIEWLPAALYRSACKIKVGLFPFDWQNCTLKFKSFAYDKSELFIKSAYNKVVLDKEAYMDNGEWTIVHCPIKTVEDPSNDKYQDITVNFILKRRPLFYVNQIICPCVLISWLAVLVFILPSASSEKMTMGISVLLDLTVYLLLLARRVPETSLGIPLIGAYLLFTMVTVTLSIVFSVFVLKLHHRSKSSCKMSPLFYYVFIVVLPRILGMEKPKSARRLLVEQSKANLFQNECDDRYDSKTDEIKVCRYKAEPKHSLSSQSNCVLKKETLSKSDCLKKKRYSRKQRMPHFQRVVRNSDQKNLLKTKKRNGPFPKDEEKNCVVNTLYKNYDKNFKKYLQIPNNETLLPVIERYHKNRGKSQKTFSKNQQSLEARSTLEKAEQSDASELSCLCDKKKFNKRHLEPLLQPSIKRCATVSGIPSLCHHHAEHLQTNNNPWGQFKNNRSVKNELQNKNKIGSLLSVAQTLDNGKFNFSRSSFSTSFEDCNSKISKKREVAHKFCCSRQNQMISTGNINLCISNHKTASCSGRLSNLTLSRKRHSSAKTECVSCEAALNKSFTPKFRLKQKSPPTLCRSNGRSSFVQESSKSTETITSSSHALDQNHFDLTSAGDPLNFSQAVAVAMESVKYISDAMRSADEKDVTLEDWHFVANVWDRLCFIFFLLTFVFGTLAFLLMALLNRVPDYPFDDEDPKYANCDRI